MKWTATLWFHEVDPCWEARKQVTEIRQGRVGGFYLESGDTYSHTHTYTQKNLNKIQKYVDFALKSLIFFCKWQICCQSKPNEKEVPTSSYIKPAWSVQSGTACNLQVSLCEYICAIPHVHMLGASVCALHVILNAIEEDQSSARLGNTHKEQGAFIHFLDPSLSSHLLSPPPAMTAWLTIRHTIGAHVPLATISSLRPVHPNKD